MNSCQVKGMMNKNFNIRNLVDSLYSVDQTEDVENIFAVACGHYTRLYKKPPLYHRNSL